jgi:hypothetical protein
LEALRLNEERDSIRRAALLSAGAAPNKRVSRYAGPPNPTRLRFLRCESGIKTRSTEKKALVSANIMYYQRKLDRDLGKLSVGGGGGGLINAAPPIQEKSTLPTIDRYNSRSSRWGARRPAATENYRAQKKMRFVMRELKTRWILIPVVNLGLSITCPVINE